MKATTVTTVAVQEARWVEYFSEVLNRPPPTIEAKVQAPDTYLDVITAQSEKEEIMAAMKIPEQLKSHKTGQP